MRKAILIDCGQRNVQIIEIDDQGTDIQTLKSYGIIDIEIPQQKTAMILDSKNPQHKWGFRFKEMILRNNTLIVAFDDKKRITDITQQQYQKIRRGVRWRRLGSRK